MTFREALNWGKEKLQHAGIPEYDLDAWLLMEQCPAFPEPCICERQRRDGRIVPGAVRGRHKKARKPRPAPAHHRGAGIYGI